MSQEGLIVYFYSGEFRVFRDVTDVRIKNAILRFNHAAHTGNQRWSAMFDLNLLAGYTQTKEEDYCSSKG